MPVLNALAVVFVGVTGPNAQPVETQLAALLKDEAHVEPSKLSAATVHRLTARAPGARELVHEMGVAGVIGGEIIVEKGHRKLAVVTFDAEGTVKSFVETPLTSPTLTTVDMDVLRSNLVDDALALQRTWKKSHPEPTPPKSPPKAEPPKAVAPEPPKAKVETPKVEKAPPKDPPKVEKVEKAPPPKAPPKVETPKDPPKVEKAPAPKTPPKVETPKDPPKVEKAPPPKAPPKIDDEPSKPLPPAGVDDEDPFAKPKKKAKKK